MVPVRGGTPPVEVGSLPGGARGGVATYGHRIWPCPLSVDAYAEAGREIEAPRPECPSCAVPMGWWSGYWRHVRAGGRCFRVFVPRALCGTCRGSHALLPAFLLVGRLDVVERIGSMIEEVAAGEVGVRPAASRVDVPYTTARGWWRRFRERESTRWRQTADCGRPQPPTPPRRTRPVGCGRRLP